MPLKLQSLINKYFQESEIMISKIKKTLKRNTIIANFYYRILYFIKQYTSSGIKAKQQLKAYLKSIPPRDAKIVKLAFNQYLKTKPKDFIKFLNSYKNVKICKVKDAILDLPFEQNEPIVICNARDDLARIKMQLEYYRLHGIRHFCYIDNMSKDGTFEYLKSQDDVTLFTTEEKYTTPVSMSWKRQIIDQIGYDRWYLCIDSDELFCYPEIEDKPFPEFIKYLEKKNIKTVCSFTLDMHQKDVIFSGTDENIFENFCYFNDFYEYKKTYFTNTVLLNKYSEKPEFTNNVEFAAKILYKVPLAKFSPDMLFYNHYFYPYKYNFDTKIISVLLHYKFISSDAKRYVRIAEEGNYSRGSEKYKKFIKNYNDNPKILFYNKHSIKFDNSKKLLNIKIFDNKFYEEF